MSQKPVILIEFNELCPRLMDSFIAAGKLPNFKRFRDEATVARTLADEAPPNLDPWIQWITVHSGVPYQKHRIHDLGDGHKLEAPNVWDLVCARGERALVCGSMNINRRPGFLGWFIPDPWTTKVPPAPDEAAVYFKLVQAYVTEYTSGKVPLTALDKARFVAFMARRGLSLDTVTAIVRQLAGERLEKGTAWKRAVILDRLQADLFKHLWKRERPAFSTFFLNSTAHFQHLYWRNMEPELFKIKPSEEDQRTYRDAILFGYQNMDRLLGELMELAGSDATLVFATAFSQQPFLAYEDRGGKIPHRPLDFARFLVDVGVTAPAKAAPVMTHQFHLDFAGEDEARAAEAKLKELTYQGRTAMVVEREGAKLFTWCQVYGAVPRDAVIEQGGRTLPFYGLFYEIDLVKSGMHHPEGMLWIRTDERTHREIEGHVPLVAIAPTLCRLLGIAPPATMEGQPLGEVQARSAA